MRHHKRLEFLQAVRGQISVTTAWRSMERFFTIVGSVSIFVDYVRLYSGLVAGKIGLCSMVL